MLEVHDMKQGFLKAIVIAAGLIGGLTIASAAEPTLYICDNDGKNCQVWDSPAPPPPPPTCVPTEEMPCPGG